MGHPSLPLPGVSAGSWVGSGAAGIRTVASRWWPDSVCRSADWHQGNSLNLLRQRGTFLGVCSRCPAAGFREGSAGPEAAPWTLRSVASPSGFGAEGRLPPLSVGGTSVCCGQHGLASLVGGSTGCGFGTPMGPGTRGWAHSPRVRHRSCRPGLCCPSQRCLLPLLWRWMCVGVSSARFQESRIGVVPCAPRCCSVEEEAGIWLWLLRVKEHFRFLQLLAHSP